MLMKIKFTGPDLGGRGEEGGGGGGGLEGGAHPDVKILV